jgi:hypothetical protein
MVLIRKTEGAGVKVVSHLSNSLTSVESHWKPFVLMTPHRIMHLMNDGTAYFSRAVSYTLKMITKSTTGVNFTKFPFFVTDAAVK